MNKEEFLDLFSSTLSDLRKRVSDISSQIEYYTRLSGNSTEFESEIASLESEKEKYNMYIEALKDMTTYPLYARIMTMSERELNEYKKEKIDELKKHLNTITSELQLKQANLAELKNEMDIISKRFMNMSEEEKNGSLLRGEKIRETISVLSSSQIPSLEEEIQKKMREIEILNSSDIEQIRNEKLVALRSYDKTKEEIKNREKLVFNSVLRKISDDSKKVSRAMELFEEYGQIEKSKVIANIPWLRGDYFYGDITNDYAIQKMRKEIEEKEEKLSETESFVNEYTRDKIIPLFSGTFLGSYNINLAFFNLHQNKISPETYEHLSSLIEERDSIKVGFFNKKKQNERINELNHDIAVTSEKLYSQILAWYSMNKPTYPSNFPYFPFAYFDRKKDLNADRRIGYLESLSKFLNDCNESVRKEREILEKFKELVAKAEITLQSGEKQKKDNLARIEDEFLSLADFKKEDLDDNLVFPLDLLQFGISVNQAKKDAFLDSLMKKADDEALKLSQVEQDRISQDSSAKSQLGEMIDYVDNLDTNNSSFHM